MPIIDISDDGEFDTGDALLLGGAMGFAEESMRVEDQQMHEAPARKIAQPDLPEFRSADMQIFKNTNLALFQYIVALVANQKAIWRKKLSAIKQNDINHELEALSKSEALLDEDM